MSINNDKEDTPVPCQNAGCTFWGRAATEGLCSKCFNAKQKEQQKTLSSATTGGVAPSTSPSTSGSVAASIVTSPSKILVDEHSNSSDAQSATPPLSAHPSSASSTTSSKSTESVPVRKVQENKSRCFQCSKKIGLTGIECKCGYVFCGAHRYPDTHSCDFDFKKHDRDLIAKSNEKITGSKLADKL